MSASSCRSIRPGLHTFAVTPHVRSLTSHCIFQDLVSRRRFAEITWKLISELVGNDKRGTSCEGSDFPFSSRKMAHCMFPC